jgi:hypothetical protein
MQLTDISNHLEKIIEDRGKKKFIKAAIAVMNELTDITPVDTTEALSNWKLTVGHPNDKPIPPFFPGKNGGTKLLSKMAVLNATHKELAKFKLGDAIYIQNNAKHIKYLDEGSSSQFSGGFAAKAMIILRQELKDGKND